MVWINNISSARNRCPFLYQEAGDPGSFEVLLPVCLIENLQQRFTVKYGEPAEKGKTQPYTTFHHPVLHNILKYHKYGT